MLKEIGKFNLIDHSDGLKSISMPHAVRQYSKSMQNPQERKALYDLIISSHYEVMEYFYFNYKTGKDNVRADMIGRAFELLQSNGN